MSHSHDGSELAFMKTALTVLGLAAALALTGCRPSLDSEVNAAQKLLDAHDPMGAIRILQPLVERNSTPPSTRALLGRAWLDAQMPAAALRHLELAHAADPSAPSVAPMLAHALCAVGQAPKAIELFAPIDPADPVNVDLSATVAECELQLGKVESASARLGKALAASGNAAPTSLLIAKARSQWQQGAIDSALQTTEAVLARQPKSPDALTLKGLLLAARDGRPAAGLQVWQEAVKHVPTWMPAHRAIAAEATSRRDLDALGATVQALQKVLPNHPETALLDAQHAFLKGDHARAQQRLVRLMKDFPAQPRVLFLAGLNEGAAGAHALEAVYLSEAVKLAPDDAAPRLAYTAALLRQGDAKKAVAILQPILGEKTVSAEGAALAASAYSAAGNPVLARTWFDRASKLEPANERWKVARASLDLASGNEAAGMAALETLARDSREIRAEMAMVDHMLRRGRTDDAVAMLERITAKQPDSPAPKYLMGKIAVGRGKGAEARTAFEAVLQKNPAHALAAIDLAALLAAERRFDAASEVLLRAIERNPQHAGLQLSQVDLKQMRGARPAEIVQALAELKGKLPDNPTVRVRWIQSMLEAGDSTAARAAAVDADARFPNVPMVTMALGRAFAATGDYQQAESAFVRAATAQPGAAEPLLQQATMQALRKDDAGALRTIERAVSTDPSSVAARVALANQLVAMRRLPEALRVAQAMQASNPRDAAGFELEGRLHARAGQTTAAAKALRHAYQVQPTTNRASELHAALVRAGEATAAKSLLDAHMAAHPQDGAIKGYAASFAMASQDWPTAERLYAEMARQQPDDAAIANNLAWSQMKLRKFDAARVEIDRALRLRPGDAALLDTQAAIFAGAADWPAAIGAQRKAIAAAPNDVGFRLSLARWLRDSGDTAGARRELDEAARLPEASNRQPQIEELRKAIGA